MPMHGAWVPACGQAAMSEAATLAAPVAESLLPLPTVNYNDDVVRKFMIASLFWAIVAFLVGCYLATELSWPAFNLGKPWINFGRLRPVHTSAAIFAFGGSALYGTSLYVVQRTCRTRLWGATRSPTLFSGATSSSSSWRR